jgi:PAS domain S-box-containing protein
VELAARRQSRVGAKPLNGRATELTLRCAPDGTIISATGSARAIIGLRSDDLISLPWPGLAHPEDSDRVARRLEEAFADPDQIVTDSHRVRRGDDRYAWVETRCRAVSGVAEIVVRDVSSARRERDRETGLRRIATLVARGASLPDTASVAVHLACRLLDARGAALAGPDGVVAGAGEIGEAEVRAGGSRDDLERAGISSGGAEWGALVVHGADVRSAESSAWLRSVAELLALCLERRDASRGASPDALDRDALVDRLSRETGRAARYGRALALAVLGFPDAPARGVPDVAAVADALRAMTRAGETIALMEGGRVVWLLPESGAVGAWQAAERVRCAMATMSADGPQLAAGIAELAPDDVGPSALVARAERALSVALAGDADVSVVHTPGLDTLLVSGRSERIESLATTADRLLPDGDDHARRVALLATSIAAELGWSSRDVQRLRDAALLHDVGKAALPAVLLDKPGRLDAAELSLVHSHAVIGDRISARVLGAEQRSWVRGHHERWDGEGYPDALGGEQIPEGARILALADAWDAMTSFRPYRGLRDSGAAWDECARCSGLQFWPPAVAALGGLLDRGRLAGSAA